MCDKLNTPTHPSCFPFKADIGVKACKSQHPQAKLYTVLLCLSQYFNVQGIGRDYRVSKNISAPPYFVTEKIFPG